MNERELERAMHAAIDQGDWETAIGHGLRLPRNWSVFDQFPHRNPPPEVLHKLLDIMERPGYKNDRGNFMFELGNNLPEKADPALLNRIGGMAMDDYTVSQAVQQHPNFKPTDEALHLDPAAKFWHEYEYNVQPHHFATIKSMYTGIPETITDHRGATGTAKPELHPHLQSYAKKVQDQIMADSWIPKKTDKYGNVHIKVYRGVGGDYGQKIKEAVNHNPETHEVDHKTLKVPTAHLTSWTTDPQMAARFAYSRGNIEGQRNDAGVVMHKWMPLKHALHSGTHTSYIGQPHAHPGESEIVFGHPEGHVKIPSSKLHFQPPAIAGKEPQYGTTMPAKVRKPKI